MVASVSAWGDKQFAVSIIKKTTSERPQGSRQVKAPARLGHYTSGTKGIDTSIRASTVPKLVVEINDDDDKDDSDKMCAGNIPLDTQKCVLIPGKYSLIRPGEVEEPQDIDLNTADEAPVQAEGAVKATRPTAKSYFDVGQGSSSTMHLQSSALVPAAVANGTKDSDSLIGEQDLMKRKRVTSNATGRKVPRSE